MIFDNVVDIFDLIAVVVFLLVRGGEILIDININVKKCDVKSMDMSTATSVTCRIPHCVCWYYYYRKVF